MLTILAWMTGATIVLLGMVIAGLAIWSHLVAKKVEAAIPPAGSFTGITGGRIHSVRSGKGRPIVLIHGLGGHLQNFAYGIPEALGADFEVIALDRPGCGYSEREGDALARIPAQARMIAEFLSSTGIERPLIVGHSLGGAVALAMALNHPDQIAGLALVAPLTTLPETGASAFDGLKITNPELRRAVGATLAVPASIRNGATTLGLIFGPDEPPADFRIRGGGLLSLRPRAFVAASTDYNAVPLDLPDLEARYGELRLPVGVLYGDRDGILEHGPHLAALRRVIPQLDEETLPGLGHMLPVSAPEATEAFIRRMAGKAFS